MSTPAKKKPASGDSRECGYCGVSEETHGKALAACARCKLVVYCCRDCQAAHWKAGHKQCCVAKADRTPAAAAAAALLGLKAGASTATPVVTGASCSICQDPIAQPEACTLSCGHAFHVKCVSSLRAFGAGGSAACCPNCRALLPPESEAGEVEAARSRFEAAEREALDWRVRSPLEEERREAWANARPDLRAAAAAAVAVFRRVAETEEGESSADPAAATVAQCYLAIALDSGVGGSSAQTQASDAEARRWFRLAAEAGNAEAQYGYAQMVEAGRGGAGGGGGASSITDALVWFRKSALQGHVEAQFHLGGLLEEAQREAYPEEAVGWITKAATAGCPEAQFNLGMQKMTAYMATGDRQGAEKHGGPWLVAAAAQGVEPAMELAGAMGLWPPDTAGRGEIRGPNGSDGRGKSGKGKNKKR